MHKKAQENTRPAQAKGQGEDPSLRKKFEKIRSRKWFITKNEHTKEDMELCEEAIKKSIYHGLVEEVGKKSGLDHFHLYLEFKNPKSLWDLIKWGFVECQCDKAKGNHEQIYTYLKKDKEPRHNLKLKEKLWIIEKLRPWQEKVVEICRTVPDLRTVNWFWNEKGNIGKTQLCKYLIVKYDALIIGGKFGDVMNGLHNYYEMYEKYPKIVVMNLGRESQKISYSGS